MKRIILMKERLHLPGIGFLLPLMTIILISYIQPVAGQVVASFNQNADYLLIDHEDFRTMFVLSAEKADYEYFTDKAGTMPETFSFTSQETAGKDYLISIKYIHKPDLLYVKKMLLFLGVDQIEIDGKVVALQDFNPAAE